MHFQAEFRYGPAGNMDIGGGKAVGQFLIGIGMSPIFGFNQFCHFLPDGLVRNFPSAPLSLR